MFGTLLFAALFVQCAFGNSKKSKPVIVVSTWPFTKATDSAWEVLSGTIFVDGVKHVGTAVNAVVAGCTNAEEDKEITSVGYGCSPDEQGHTTLDAMVMDGDTMNVGAVAAMPYIRHAIQVARDVLHTTKHTLLVGYKATEFAVSRGYTLESLDTPESRELWWKWKRENCQPNYREPPAWYPNPQTHCGPYEPTWRGYTKHQNRPVNSVNEANHDTIGMIAIDAQGSMAVGLSTSGAIHKIPGRVGDTAIPGSGGYVDTEIGGAVGTGDGDVLMRFALSFQAVSYMRQGMDPMQACETSLRSVKQKGPWSGALVAMNTTGHYGAACIGFQTFQIAIRSASTGNASVTVTVPCKPT